jgi:radical SAM protein with 4Fe4S-binding SPASM domain
MSLLSHDSFWNAIIGLPTTKKMLDLSLKKCGGCGRPIIEAALDDYVGKSNIKCDKCSFYSQMIRFWVEFLRLSLSVKKDKLNKLLADPYARRAITTITRTFTHLGIRKPLSVYSPFLVVWDFTHRCNLSCKHCYSNSGASSQEELTTREALNAVDQLADFGVTALAFSGGEPLTRKDFFEVAGHAVESGLYVSVATNGTLLNKENVKKLKETRINYVEISIDGATSRSHDEFRGVQGAFESAINGLKNCVEEDLCACIATTATKNNLEEIPEILNLAEEIGAERFTYFNFIPTGRGKTLYDQDLAPEEREKLMLFLLNKILRGSKVAILTTAPQLARVALQYQGGQREIAMSLAHMQTAKIGRNAVALADFIGGCGAGRLYCSLSPEGDVHPCVFLPIKVGNLKNEKFEDIWLNSKLFNALRDRSNLKGACGKCDFKYVCGGCRARAFAYHNDLLASDVGCILAKNEERSPK